MTSVPVRPPRAAQTAQMPAVPGPSRPWVADAQCPLRPGEPCTLCHPEADGPQSCPTVAIVMADDDLRAELARRRAAYRAAHHAGRRAVSPAGPAPVAPRP